MTVLNLMPNVLETLVFSSDFNFRSDRGASVELDLLILSDLLLVRTFK